MRASKGMEKRSLKAFADVNKMRVTHAVDGEDQPSVTFAIRFFNFPAPFTDTVRIGSRLHFAERTRGRDEGQLAGRARLGRQRDSDVIFYQCFIRDGDVEFRVGK